MIEIQLTMSERAIELLCLPGITTFYSCILPHASLPTKKKRKCYKEKKTVGSLACGSHVGRETSLMLSPNKKSEGSLMCGCSIYLEDQPCHLIDLGCGYGLSGETLTEQGHTWTGVDISSAMLSIFTFIFNSCLKTNLL